MKSPFPYPALKYLPKQMQDDPDAIALASALDRASAGMLEDILLLGERYNPESCPAEVLDELGYGLSASLYPTDSDATKRAKISGAIKAQKTRSTWQYSAKVALDAIVVPLGSSGSSLWASWDDTAVWLLRGALPEEPDNYMASMGIDGVDLNLGIALIGEGTEFEVAGNVYVDLGISTLTAEQVALCVASLDDVAPAYMRVKLGYSVAGQFMAYAGGQIG